MRLIANFARGFMQAYRPCPTAAAKGVRYSRVGQSLDEIVFKKNPKGGYCMCPTRRLERATDRQ